ncbi:glycoside hydrolase family 32 protein [Schizophyllum commune]
MATLKGLFLGALLSGLGYAQTNEPVAGDYSGALRPQIHFSPPTDFMNDPNGCFVDANGTWHLYYQYNPTDLVAGNQHWGHATSKDLYHWENQPIAIYPPDNTSQVFSGSAVIDVNNTSGFFPNQTDGVVAIYTLNTPDNQVQEISYSRDGGYTFTPYEGNPVININSTQFRDPKVIRYEDSWVAVIAYSQEFVIGIFTSPDLIHWTHASNFTHHGLLGLQYECPNLVKIPVEGSDEEMYLLTISLNPGAPLGGSVTEYFPGTFNGTHFTPVDGAARLADFGKDNYAGQFFYGVPEDEHPVSIAWASNWQYTANLPTGKEGWRSAMTVPRRHYLTQAPRIGWDLVQVPVDLSPVLGAELGSNDALVNASLTVDFADVKSNAVVLEVNVTGTAFDNSWVKFAFRSPSSGEALLGGCLFVDVDITCYVDRGKTHGFEDPFFTDKVSLGQIIKPSGEWTATVIFDRSIIEVLLDGGLHSGTQTFFPTEPLTILEVNSSSMPDTAQVAARVTALKSGWEEDVAEEKPQENVAVNDEL